MGQGDGKRPDRSCVVGRRSGSFHFGWFDSIRHSGVFTPVVEGGER